MKSFRELSVKELLEKAEEIIEEYCEERSLPVEIEDIIDAAGLEIIPVTGLNELDIKAGLASDFSSIFVDSELYRNDNKINMMRFSLAHEFGHFILHKDIFEKKTECVFFHEVISQNRKLYNELENQTNIFSDFLLVPENELAQAIRDGIDMPGLLQRFGVSEKLMAKRYKIYCDMHHISQ